MLAKNVNFNKISKLVFVLLIVLSIGFTIAFASGRGLNALAYNANDDTASTHVDVEIDNYAESLETGASITLKATALEEASAPNAALAMAHADQTAIITLSGDVWEAVKSGRMKARLLASGTNSFQTLQGSETTYKSATYSVSGALSGNGSFDLTVDSDTNQVKDASYENLEIAPETLLSEANGNQIIINYVGQWFASESKTSLGTNVAEATIDCFMSFTLELTFENAKVTINSTVGGKVKDASGTEFDLSAGATELTLGFEDSASFTAVPDDGYYFLGWREEGTTTDESGTVKDLGKAISISSTLSPSFSARFQKIEISESSSYSYSGEGQGPVVNASRYTGVYYLTHLYQGTANDGTAINLASEGTDKIVAGPSLAGDYVYTCEFYYRVYDSENNLTKGEKIGSIVKNFTIERNVANVSRTAGDETTVEFKYGDNLTNFSLAVSAVNSVSTSVNVYGSVALYYGDELVDLEKLLPHSETGLNYTFRFTPNDRNNYQVVDREMLFIVKDKMVDNGVNLEEGKRSYTISKSTVTSVDESIPNNVDTLPDGAEVVKVSLRATMLDESGHYFFIGWRIGTLNASGEYAYNYLTSGEVTRDADGKILSIEGLEYDYYLPYFGDSNYTDEQKEAYKTASFQAVFVKDTTADENNTLTLHYSGAPSNRTATFSPEPAGYQFGAGDLIYYHASNPTEGVGTIPTAIGEHTLKYVIKNTALDVVVDTRVIKYVITIGEVNAKLNETKSVGYGMYNQQTGWAQKFYYDLSVSRLIAGSVESYYYSVDNGNTWNLVAGTIANESGCAISFETPDVVNDTVVSSYLFMATHSTHGQARTFGEDDVVYNVVAITNNYVTTKIDTVVPTIENVVEVSALNGAWTASAIDFSALLSYGGSGAVLKVAYGTTSNTWITLDSEAQYLSSDLETKTENLTANFSLNTEFSGMVRFRISTGTKVDVDFATEFEVNIDKTIPTIPSPSSDKNVNAYGWIGEATTFTYEIVDLGGSGINRVEAINLSNNGASHAINEVDGKWQIVITDSCQYQINAYDNAGNISATSLQALVDVEDLEYAFASESYVPGEWASENSAVIFDVTMGASGARLLYSVNAGDWIPVSDFTEAKLETISQELTLGYLIPVSDDINSYSIKIQSRAGKEFVIEVGEVKFDLVAPVVTLLTDLSAYQGAVWTSQVLVAEFTAFDTEGVVNSGLGENAVTVDNGGKVTSLGNGKYSIEVDKCTVFTISVKDEAGNITILEVQANVDTVEPLWLENGLVAYIGGGNPENVDEEPAGDENEIYNFEDWITKAKAEPWVRIEFNVNLTASGTRLEYSNNGGSTWTALTSTFLPEPGEVEGQKKARVYLTTEQNRQYSFRLVTGSGKVKVFEPEDGKELYVRIDFTTPTLRSETFRTDTSSNFPLKTTWINKDAQYRIMLQDTALGSGINESSIILNEYPLVDDEYIVNGLVEPTVRQMNKSGDYFTYDMTSALKYVLVFSDNAGNEYKSEIFTACIDKTSGFTLNMSAFATSEGVGHTPLDQDYWFTESDYAVFQGTVKGLENDTFGPSGGKMQFSVDGGANWLDSINVGGDLVSVTNVGNVFTLEFTKDQQQVYDYSFRVITGAGTEYVHSTVYKVQKDDATPTISAVATYQSGGASYGGEWTKENLRFTISLSVGVAGGTLYYGVGDSAESADWAEMETIAKNGIANLTRYFVIDYSLNDNLFFRFASGKPDVVATTASAIVVQLDKTEIDFTIVAELENGNSVSNGSWVSEQATIYPSFNVIGASGISSVYLKTNFGAGYSDYTLLPDNDYAQVLNANTESLVEYVFKVVSVSGMEGESDVFKLGYDDNSPDVQISFSGSKLPAGNRYQDWYISDVQVQILATQNASGVQIYYQRKANGEDSYSEWTKTESTFTLVDNSEKGGSDYYYQFKVVTGSSIEIILEKSAGVTEYYLPIDTNVYSVTVNSFVGDIESDETHSFAEISGEGEYMRGSSVSLVIEANETYRIKSRSTVGVSVDDVADYNYDNYSDAVNGTDAVSFVIGGQDVSVTVDFFKEVTLSYSNEKQFLQTQTIKEVEFSATEEGFDDFFGEVSKKTDGEEKIVGVTATYFNSIGQTISLPQEIGIYTFKLTMQEGYENFYIVNAQTTLTIVYFAGSGTSVDPYLVEDETDFGYIDEYMHFEDSDATLDSRAYLGGNRRTAYFKQTGDIITSTTFKPIAGKGAGYTEEFKGTYDGNGFEFFYPNTYVINSDFGLFLNVNEASIINLGVRINLRATDVEETMNVGFVVANAVDSGLRSVYAVGNATFIGCSGIRFGGIVGYAERSLISYSFADVNVVANGIDGNVGGIVGRLNGAYTANVYSVSRITVTNSERYDPTAPATVKFAFAGAIAGFVENLEDAGSLPSSSNKSYYLDRNLGYDGSIEVGLSIGNRDTFGQYASLMHQGENIDFFASSGSELSHADVKIIEITNRNYVVTVVDLVRIRIDEIKAQANMSGEGTNDNPFLVDNEAKLLYVANFPWAVFKQTADVMLSEGTALATSVPFVGVYDGDGYSLTGAKIINDSARYGGVFGVVSGTIKNLKILDVALDYSANEDLYVGGVVGILEGGVIDNVIVTGTVNAIALNDAVAYAGGIVGVVIDGKISNSIAIVNVNVEGKNLVSGSIVAQVQGNATLQTVVSTSSISAHYLKKANVGATSGAITSAQAELKGVYYLVESAYANDKSIAYPVGYNAGANLEGVLFKSYKDVIALEVNGTTVQNAISGLYPFEGSGTKDDPFVISDYQSLKLISNYMYASFVLGDNIVIGDYNDDGKLDSQDGYDYDYSPIGNGATFTGSLDGEGYSIIGLTDSLFEVNAGSVSDVTLNVNYKVYAHADDIPDSDKVIDSDDASKYYTSAKVAQKDEEILFGALAKINRSTGSIIRVNVTGTVYVRTYGRAKVTLGGIIGVDMGGQIAANLVSLNTSARASQLVAGGIVGEIRYSDRALGQMGTNDVVSAGAINLGGASVIAGVYVGRLSVATDKTMDYVSNSEIIVNGVSIGSDVCVGSQK